MPKSFIQCTKFSQRATIFTVNNHGNNNNINTMSKLIRDPIHQNILVSDPIIVGIGVNGTFLGAILKISHTKVFLVSFYLNNNNPKKSFNFTHFPRIGNQKTGQKPNIP